MKKILPIAVLLAVAAIVIYATQGGESPEDYTERIQTERERIARFMNSSGESPFAPDLSLIHI